MNKKSNNEIKKLHWGNFIKLNKIIVCAQQLQIKNN